MPEELKLAGAEDAEELSDDEGGGGCACCGCTGKSDLDELEARPQLTGKDEKHYMRSWHDSMTLKEKKKLAAKNKHAECWFCKCCGIFGAWSGLQCCCCAFGKNEPLLSINEDRHCTDVPCCVLFLVGLAVQFLLFMLSVQSYGADPRRLLFYADWEGNLCAPSFPNSSYEFSTNTTIAGNFAAWPDIRMFAIRICVESCNDTVLDSRIVTPSLDSDVNFDVDVRNGSFTVDISGYRTREIFNAFCIPDPNATAEVISAVLDNDYEQFRSTFDSVSDKVSLAVNDVSTASPLLFIICSISALIVSMLWGACIRKFGSIIVWGSIFFTIAGLFLMSYYLIEYSKFAYLFGYYTIGDVMYYSGVTIGVADCMFALAICFMWKRILLAIAMAKETTRALTDVWTLFFYPIVPFAFFVAYMVYWMVTGVFIASVQQETVEPFPLGYTMPYYDDGPTLQNKLNLPAENAEYVIMESDPFWQNICLYHFFILLWVVNFISYHTFMVIAGVYAEWYFTDWKDEKETVKWRGRDTEVLMIGGRVVENEKELKKVKEEIKAIHKSGTDQMGDNQPKEELVHISKLSRCPTLNSFWRVTFYHTGTIAFASLLIAIVEFIEYTLTYFEKKFVGSEPSPIQKLIICLVRCALRCIKCILNRINRNGMIITSIYGWPFCASSMKGIVIILKNILRATALDMVSGYLEKLGKISILAANLAVCIMFARYYYGDELSSVVLPTVLCFGITFVICWQYMHLFEVGISTIFICFLIDEERNKKLGTMKASKRLRKIIGANQPTKHQMMNKAKSVRNVGLTKPLLEGDGDGDEEEQKEEESKSGSHSLSITQEDDGANDEDAGDVIDDIQIELQQTTS